MITKCFAVMDIKAAAYNTPFFMANNALAIRAFSDLVNDTRSKVNSHPEDYTLYFIGDFDDCLGVMTDCDRAIPLVTAVSVLKPDFSTPDARLLAGALNHKVEA